MSILPSRKTAVLLLVLCLSGTSSVAWAQNFDDGLDKYNKQDYAGALREWQPLANRGDVAAQERLGTMYMFGIGVEKNYATAAQWYRKAAEQGYANAQFNLGMMYATGRGVKQDDAQAAAWYRKAADQGHDGAIRQRRTVEILSMIRERSQSPTEAAIPPPSPARPNTATQATLREQAERGDMQAQFGLGLAYATGSERNPAEALKWYRKAADQGHMEAQYQIGIDYMTGSKGVTDYALSEKYLKMAAAHASAQTAQAQLLRVARIQNLGGLTTSIAHELNQPLAAMATSTDAARRWLERPRPDAQKALQALARIRADAERASAIIARVRRLTRGQAPHAGAFDFNAAIGEMLALSRSAMQRGGITLQTALAPNLPAAWGDRVQIQQVVANLLLNAIEAMRGAEIKERTLQVTSARQGNMLLACVRDSGAGIAPQRHAQVFDAFWSDKPGGIGLGLSISRSIVEAHGGRIEVQAAAQGGALFHFSVPMAPAAKETA